MSMYLVLVESKNSTEEQEIFELLHRERKRNLDDLISYINENFEVTTEFLIMEVVAGVEPKIVRINNERT